MHFWPNKSCYLSSKLSNVKNLLANRPKGLSDQDWNEIVAEAKLNKKIVLDTVPKTSKKDRSLEKN